MDELIMSEKQRVKVDISYSSLFATHTNVSAGH